MASNDSATAGGRSRLLRPYILALLTLGSASAATGLFAGGLEYPAAVISLALAVAIAERLSFPLYFDGRLSISFVGVVAAAAWFGPAAAVIVCAVVAVSAWRKPQRNWERLAFNFGAQQIAGFCASGAVMLVDVASPGSAATQIIAESMVAGVVVYFVTTVTVALVVSLSSGRRALSVHRAEFAWLLPHYIALSALAGGLELVYDKAGLTGAFVLCLPLISSRWAMKQLLDKTRDGVQRLEASNAELQRANAEISAMIEAIPDAMLFLNTTGLVLEWQAAGHPPLLRVEDPTGWPIARVVPPSLVGPFAELQAAARHGETAIRELEWPLQTGETQHYEARVAPAENGECLLILRDITERKRIEAARKMAEDLVRMVTSNSPLILFATDTAGTITFVEGKGLERLGMTPSDLLRTPVWSSRGGWPGKRQYLQRALSGEEFGADDEVEGRVFESHYGPMFDRDARIMGITGVIIDVTERRRVEAAMLEAQKLESLGLLAGGIAHDFNNLLVGILGNAGLAQSELPPGSRAAETIGHIELAGKRAADLARQMLAYSGKGRFVVEPVDLNGLIDETSELLRASIVKGARLELDLSREIPPVTADATQLRQVVMNLVINASDAIGDRTGRIFVSTSRVHADTHLLADAFKTTELPEGDYISLRVEDTGSGMDAETRNKIFDPFFSTKFTGRGLGLAATLGIIRSHQGAIRVESEPGMGTVFELLLPVAEGVELPRVRQARPVLTSPVSSGETILVIDDEPTVRGVTARALQHFGFKVVQAIDGLEGVEIFERDPDAFDLVLLDMTMPRMNGEAAFTAIRAIRSDVAVVLMSGYAEEEATGRFSGRGLDAFLQKPFELSALLDTIRGALEAHSPHGDHEAVAAAETGQSTTSLLTP